MTPTRAANDEVQHRTLEKLASYSMFKNYVRNKIYSIPLELLSDYSFSSEKVANQR